MSVGLLVCLFACNSVKQVNNLPTTLSEEEIIVKAKEIHLRTLVFSPLFKHKE